MRFRRPFLIAIAILALAEAFVFGQAGDEAKKIYSASQDSVFLVYLNDSSGTPSALGSAFLLRYRRDFPIAVVEAKSIYATPGDGLQQAKEYAQILGLKFAYATNGRGIVEHDFLTGRDNDLDVFPTSDDLWGRLRGNEGIDEKTAERVLAPCYHLSGKSPRYYQEIAINRMVQGILQGKRRILLTLATGTGKTVIAFQISYKLWNSRWNRAGEHRRPRILYLADRNILVDDPKDKTFTPFGDARWKIEGKVVKSREMYFATYQAIARDEQRPGLYRELPREFFDLPALRFQPPERGEFANGR